MDMVERPAGAASVRPAPEDAASQKREIERLRDEVAELRETHARDAEALRLLREVVPVSLYTTDLRTLATVPLTADLASVLGYPPGHLEAMGGEAMANLIHPSDRQLMADMLSRWDRVTDDRWLDSEMRFRHVDGSWRWIASRQAVIGRDAGGKPTALVGAAWDVTERKELEAALARSQTLEAVGRLAGGIAHDFNNLLTVLMGNLSLAQTAMARGADPSSMLAQVGAVAREASRLTKQLLTFASREVGSADVIDVAEETRGLLGVLRRLVEDDIELIVECGTDPAWVAIQRAQLTQILLNLVVNARDAMPRGGRLLVEVRAATRTVEDQPARPGTVLRVKDSGEGMSAATRQRIFDPFFTTKLPGKGTGLGLSTVYGIVRARGGAIEVHSEEGRGTTFEVWFPAAAAPAPTSRRSSPHRAAIAAGTTVLVVEDNAPLAETCVAILGGAGYRVLVAKDGEAALEVLRREGDRVAAVLSDIVMPRVSGTELAARLAKISPRTRIVLWSGYPQGGGEPRGNVIAVLPKPVEPEVLLAALARAVAASRPGPGGSTT